MKRLSLLTGVFLLTALPSWAAPVPLKDVTQDKLRAWTDIALKASRNDPARADFWKEFDDLIVIDPDTIVYEHDKGVPTKLVWQAKPKRDLNKDERDKAEQMLRKFWDFSLFEHEKGLLTKEEAKKLDAVTTLAVGPNPTPPPKVADKTVPLKDLTQDKLRAWTAIALQASRNDPAKADFWKELDALIVVEPDTIIYEHNKGEPVRVFWECKPKKALDGAERDRAGKRLREFYDWAILVHDKGLLSPADAKTLDAVTRVEIGPNPAAPKVADNEEIDKLRKDIGDLRSEIDKFRKERADAEAEIEKARKERADFAAEIEKLRKDRVDLLAQIDALAKKGADALDAMDKLRKERTDLQTQIDVLVKKQTDLHTDIDELRKEQVNLQIALEGVRKDIASFHGEIDVVKKELVKIRVEIDVKGRTGDRPAETLPRSTPRSPSSAAPSGYIMVVQPSSMIYYDCWSHCWLPGPAYVVFYPAGTTEAPRRVPAPSFMPPAPAPVAPSAVELKGPERIPTRVPEQSRNPEEGGRAFWVGYRSYWQGDYDRALASFDAAVRNDGEDARFWYYKALAERALGDTAKAEASAQHGRDLHAAQKPKADLVGAALERVQGQERRFLKAPEVVVTEAKDDR